MEQQNVDEAEAFNKWKESSEKIINSCKEDEEEGMKRERKRFEKCFPDQSWEDWEKKSRKRRHIFHLPIVDLPMRNVKLYTPKCGISAKRQKPLMKEISNYLQSMFKLFVIEL